MSEPSTLRALAITSLFPNRVAPNSATFNRQQLHHLAHLCDLDVWATVPWFPGAKTLAPSSFAARFADVPAFESIDSMEVSHPRTLHLPVVGRAIAGPLFAASIAARFTQIRHKIDVVLGTWAYPDAWASVVLGTIANVPTVVKVHGSDINVVAQKPLQRFQLARVLPKAAAVVAVSRALADEIANLGVPAENIHVIRNGVDGERFFLGDRALARRALANAHPRADAAFSQDGPVVLFVGNLKTEKGIHDLLEAWPTVVRDCPTATLCIVGGGSESERVKRQCAELPSAFAIGPVDHTEVALWMRASTLLCLPSWNEGTPNVVLESLACGRPVVASSVGGIPEVVNKPILGTLVAPRSPSALATALSDCLNSIAPQEDVAAAAEVIDWQASAGALHQILLSATRR